MIERDELLKLLEGKTEEEIKAILEEMFSLYWHRPQGPCKAWFARLFTYCSAREFQRELDFFFWLVNTFGYLWGICFQEEKTEFLGCTCPCGNKQTIVYYSVTFGD